MSITIYHNPRCSKSRQALELIKESGNEPQIIEYLKTPLANADIKKITNDLGLEDVRAMMRTGEAVYKELNLAQSELDQSTLIEAMAANPILIERPIITSPKGTVIGRPPENVKKIL